MSKQQLRLRVRGLTAAARGDLVGRVREAPYVELGESDENEDWLKTSWDFTRQDGTPIDTLAELEQVLGSNADSSVAEELLRLPFGKAAPPKLIAEAQAAVAQKGAGRGSAQD